MFTISLFYPLCVTKHCAYPSPSSSSHQLYLRLQLETRCKIVPISENLVFEELQDIIRTEFNCTQWERLSITVGADFIDIVTQRDLDYVLVRLQCAT